MSDIECWYISVEKMWQDFTGQFPMANTIVLPNGRISKLTLDNFRQLVLSAQGDQAADRLPVFSLAQAKKDPTSGLWERHTLTTLTMLTPTVQTTIFMDEQEAIHS